MIIDRLIEGSALSIIVGTVGPVVSNSVSHIRQSQSSITMHWQAQRLVLSENPLDFVHEARATTGHVECLPDRCEAGYALAKRSAVVLFVEKTLLVLIKHVVPVRLLRDLPLAKAAAFLRRATSVL